MKDAVLVTPLSKKMPPLHDEIQNATMFPATETMIALFTNKKRKLHTDLNFSVAPNLLERLPPRQFSVQEHLL